MQLMTDPIAENRAAVERYAGAHDASLLRQDATFVDQTSGMRWTGPEAIGGMLDWLYNVAFDARAEEIRLIAGADAVVLEATFVGTHRGEFAGVPATGREVRVPLVVIYDLVDGQIAGARIHFSVASFIAQVAPGGGLA